VLEHVPANLAAQVTDATSQSTSPTPNPMGT
jgi:hypothetical protein